MWNVFIIAFVLVTAFSDLRWRKVPRALMVVGFVVGLIVNGFRDELMSAAIAAVLGFGIGLALFSLGAIGGGDVKLVTALGAMLGLKPWLMAMQVAILLAAAIGIVQVIRRGALRATIRNVGIILKSLVTKGFKAHPVLNVNNPATIRSPFAVAAAVGTLFAMLK